MVQVLKDNQGIGGVVGLKQARTEAATSTAVKHAVSAASVSEDGQGKGKMDGGAVASSDFRWVR